jgi:hypothetical protein
VKSHLLFGFFVFSVTIIFISCGNSVKTDETPPTISITNPADGAVIKETIIIKANAADKDGIEKVLFLVDGEVIGYDNSAPYEQLWNVYFWADDDLHTILAEATDEAGNVGLSNLISVTVSTEARELLALISPDSGEAFSDTDIITFTWNALKDAENYTIQVSSDYEFENIEYDNTLRDTSVVISVNLSAGVYYWRLRAQDSSNVSGEWSKIRSFIFSNTPPELTSPGDTTIEEGQALTFTIEAEDRDGDSLQFSVPVKPAEATLTNQQFSWTPNYEQSGIHHVTFVVTDDGEPNLSDTVDIIITVENVGQPPTIADVAVTGATGGTVYVGVTYGIAGLISDDVGIKSITITLTDAAGTATTITPKAGFADQMVWNLATNEQMMTVPVTAQEGSAALVVTVRDEEGLTVSDTVALTVDEGLILIEGTVTAGSSGHSTLGASIDLDADIVYLAAEAAATIFDIDLVYLTDGGSDKLFSPDEAKTVAGWSSWANLNPPIISFFKTDLNATDFHNIINVEQLEEIWDSGTPSTTAISVVEGDVLITETTEGWLALLLIVEQAPGAAGSITIKSVM